MSLVDIEEGAIAIEVEKRVTDLGGQNLENSLVQHCIEEFNKLTGANLI